MSEEQLKQLDTTSDELIQSLEKVEQEIDNLEGDLEREKQMKHLARLIYEGQLIEQGRLMYSFNKQSYCQIQNAKNKSLRACHCANLFASQDKLKTGGTA